MFFIEHLKHERCSLLSDNSVKTYVNMSDLCVV